MTYHININKTNDKAFLEIAGALKKLGIIKSIEANKSLVREGTPLVDDTLISILEFSKKEIENGNSLSMDDIKNKIEAWKKKY